MNDEPPFEGNGDETNQLESLIADGIKSKYFPELLAGVEDLCLSLGFSDRDRILTNLSQLWLPMALNLAVRRSKLDRTFIQGILGGQGTGKTTLCLLLQHILNYFGLATATLSIDDLYLTYKERENLRKEDPRLIWRGPPGTHDVTLGIEVIDRCLQGNSSTQILLPRFDKSAFNGAGDRISPEAINKPDILLFEGWFVGVQPLDKYPLNFPDPIVTPEDKQFAKDNNQRLKDYLPLWNKLDSLIVLYPEDHRLCQMWRREAEQKMIATGKSGMSDEECDRFVEYFWKALHPELYIKPLLETANLVIEIKSDRHAKLCDVKD